MPSNPITRMKERNFFKKEGRSPKRRLFIETTEKKENQLIGLLNPETTSINFRSQEKLLPLKRDEHQLR